VLEEGAEEIHDEPGGHGTPAPEDQDEILAVGEDLTGNFELAALTARISLFHQHAPLPPSESHNDFVE
jgi:hypothetical protein